MVVLLALLGCSCGTLLPLDRPRTGLTDQRRHPVATVAGAAIAWRAGLPLQVQPPPPSPSPPPLLRMKPRDRARVLAALAGLVILGFTLVLLAWWGARFTRRYLRRPWPDQRRRQPSGVSEFDWANKPLYDTREADADSPTGDDREG